MKDTLLLIHSTCGVLVFLLGLLQALLPKRGKSHRYLGRIYVFLWLPLVISGGYLGSWIILALGGLGFYAALTAWRYAKVKHQLYSRLDQGIVLAGASLVLALATGTVYLFYSEAIDFAIIMCVFSIVFGVFIQVDLREVVFQKSVRRRSAHKMYWFFEHYGRMYISMIAAFSAFSAIQQPFSNQLVNWLWPTLAGTIVLIFLGKYYDKKHSVN
jgi:hypothetical protein